MSKILMDGPGELALERDVLTVTSSSAGEKFVQSWRLDDVETMIADYMAKIGERDGRPSNIVAFKRAAPL